MTTCAERAPARCRPDAGRRRPLRRAPARDGARGTRRVRPPTGSARRCSRSSARSTARGCSTSSPARARWRSRRSRAARRTPRWSSRTPGRAAVIERNLETLGPVAARRRSCSAMPAARALRAARERGDAYDLVFLDPPYRQAPALGQQLAADLAAVLAPGARVVTESDRRAPMDLPLPPPDERRYGDTLIRIHTTHDSVQSHRRLPGLLRPDHERPPRRHRARSRDVRRGRRRRRQRLDPQGQVAVRHRGAPRVHRGRRLRTCRTSAPSRSTRSSSTSRRRSAPRRSSRACARSRTSSTSSR